MTERDVTADYWALVELVAEAQYEDARQHRGECEGWPAWDERDGLIGADYMNAAQAAIKVLLKARMLTEQSQLGRTP